MTSEWESFATMDPGDYNNADGVHTDFVSLAAGQTVGRYEIASTLGQGSFGITYRARDTRLGRDVAIKEYLPSALAIRHDGASVLPRSTKVLSDFTWGRDRFVAEGQTLASLQNAPAIVRVFDFLEANNTAYIVMQLLSGETLESQLKHKRLLTPNEVDRILWPILDGLEQVHSAGFLHRDIKPSNILLDAEGNATLIDFGASRAAVAEHTKAMTAVFTPGYAAAEQFTSAKQGPWTDIYGLSATIYEAIVGKVPPSAFERMLDDDYEPLQTLRPEDFSPGLLGGLDAGLKVRSAERPQSISIWRTLLRQSGTSATAATLMLRSGPSGVTAPTTIEALEVTALPSRKRMTMWAAAFAAGVSILAIGGYWALPPSKIPSATPPVDPVAEQNRIGQEAERERTARAIADQAAEDQAKDKAEADAAEKARKDEEARQQAAVELSRQRAEEELTRKNVEAEAAKLLQAQEDDARRMADAERAAQQKAAAEAATKQQEIEASKKAAEVGEVALSLSQSDRQRIQVALTSLGFNTRGNDGVFGPRSREMIAAWQRKENQVTSGFLSATQRQTILREGATAVSKFDEEQKKIEQDKKAEDEAKARAAVQPPAPPAAAPSTIATPTPNLPATEIVGNWTGKIEDWKLNNQPGREMTVRESAGIFQCTFYISGDLPARAKSCTFKNSLLSLVTGQGNRVELSLFGGKVLRGTFIISGTGQSFPFTMRPAQ